MRQRQPLRVTRITRILLISNRIFEVIMKAQWNPYFVIEKYFIFKYFPCGVGKYPSSLIDDPYTPYSSVVVGFLPHYLWFDRGCSPPPLQKTGTFSHCCKFGDIKLSPILRFRLMLIISASLEIKSLFQYIRSP